MDHEPHRRLWLGIVGALVLVASLGGLYWRSQGSRLDDLKAAVESFEPRDRWDNVSLVHETEGPYRPWCVDADCPYFARRYIVAVPEGDMGPAVSEAVADLDLGPVIAPARDCIAGEFCWFRVEGDVALGVVMDDPFDAKRGMVEVPPGHVEISLAIGAS